MNCHWNAAFHHKNLLSTRSRLMRIRIRMLKTSTTLSQLELWHIITLAILTCLCRCQVWQIGQERKWGHLFTVELCRVPELRRRLHPLPWSITSPKVREIRCHWALDHRLISHQLRAHLWNRRQITQQRPPLIHCLRWDMSKLTMLLVASLMPSKTLLSRIPLKPCIVSNNKNPQLTIWGTLCPIIPNVPTVCPSCSSLNSLLTASAPILSTTTVVHKWPVVSPSNPLCHSTTVRSLHVQAIISKALARNKDMQRCSKAIDLVNHLFEAAIRMLLVRVKEGDKVKLPCM